MMELLKRLMVWLESLFIEETKTNQSAGDTYLVEIARKANESRDN